MGILEAVQEYYKIEGLEEGRQKGRQEGLQEGLEKGIRLSIRNMLLKGFAKATIQDVLEVSAELVEQVEQELKANSEMS